MIHAFPRTACASPYISNRPRERQFPRYCAGRVRDARPLRARKGLEAIRADWVRATRRDCKLRPIIPADAQFPGVPFVPPGSAGQFPTMGSRQYSRGKKGDVLTRVLLEKRGSAPGIESTPFDV